MRNVDIMEAIVSAMEETIRKEWRHEVVIEGWTSGYINVDIDEKEYVLILNEVQNGQHWSQFIPEGRP